jgi:hypothetical protein
MGRRSAETILLVALHGYLAVSVGMDLVGDGVWPWLVSGTVAVTGAVGTLIWADAVREWWATEVGEPSTFALGAALSLCLVPAVVAPLLTPEPVLYAYRLFALGLVGGYVIVSVCDQTGVSRRVRGGGAE